MLIEFDTINILLAVSAIFVSLLGLFVYSKDNTNKINSSFFFFTLAVGMWSLLKILSRSVVDEEFVGLVFGALYIVAASTPVFFLYFASALTGNNTKKYLIARQIMLFIFIFIAVISLVPNLLVHNVEIISAGEPIVTFNRTFVAIYALFLTSMYAWGYSLIFTKYTRTSTDKKIQLAYILIGTSIPPLVGTITNLILPVFGIFAFSWVGQISIAIAVSIVVYGMFRHNVFDTRVIVAEVTVFALWLIMFFRIVTSDTVNTVLMSTVTFAATILIGLLLMKSMEREIETHDKLENLTAQLKESNDRLRQLDQLKTEFLSIATHQLRTPLTAIKGYMSLVLEGAYGKVPESLEKVLNNIFKSSSLMAETITDFMNVSRIELGHIEYNKADFNCAQLIQEVVQELQPRAHDAGLKLVLEHECTEGESPIIYGDYGKVKYIFSNLIENAIKYTPKGTVTVSGEVDTNRKVSRITITDTGIGIDKDELDDLFSKFKRARNAHNINIQGTGLGLYVARKMVRAHDGHIWVESDGEGKGSRFIVELPYVRIENK